MKHSNHSPSPPSPVSRKRRSDSKLAALAPDVQSLLLQKLETLSYQQTAAWLQDTHGICVSPSNLSTFRSRHLESEALKQAYLQAAVFNSILQDLPEMDPGDEQVEAAVRRLFLFKIVGQGDIGAYLQFTRLGNESKKLALTQARQERLQQERSCASEEEDGWDSGSQASFPPEKPFAPLSSPAALRSPVPVPPQNAVPSDPDPGCAEAVDPFEEFQAALDAVMPLDGAEPVPPSRLDPFYATIIGTVIGRMLDLIQSGKLPFASASPSAAAPPPPAVPPPSATSTPSPDSPTELPLASPAASPDSEAQPSSASSSVPTSPPSPSNSLKYPKTPAIQPAGWQSRAEARLHPDGRLAPAAQPAGSRRNSRLGSLRYWIRDSLDRFVLLPGLHRALIDDVPQYYQRPVQIA